MAAFSDETTEKIAHLRRYLAERGLHGAVLASRANFAWLTGGGDNHVVSQSEGGVAAILVSAQDARVLTSRIEADRIRDEEPVAELELEVHPWTTSIAEALQGHVAGRRVVGDEPSLGLEPLPGDFVPVLRSALLPVEVARFAALGSDCSRAMEKVVRNLAPGVTEQAVAGMLAQETLSVGVQPMVLLVAFDARVAKYRHPTPTRNTLRTMAMVVLCGRRSGLVVSLTRLVHFGALPSELRARHDAVCRVEGALWDATRPGVPWGEVLRAGIDAYHREGFPDEWLLHHQGGPAGYASRDRVVGPDDVDTVQLNQAVAWNPSITGTKSEDTFITLPHGRRVLTAASADWPMIDVVTASGERLKRPGILVR